MSDTELAQVIAKRQKLKALHRDLDLTPRAPGDLLAVAFEDVKGTAPDRSDPEQADLDGFHLTRSLQRVRCRRPASSAKRRSTSDGRSSS